jgi:ABC-2 type transport system permease protein
MQVTLMRSRFWTLYRTLLNDHYGFSAAKFYYIKKRQRTWEPILIVAGVTPAVVMAVIFIWKMTEQLFMAGLAFGQPHLALLNGALLVALAGLFFGFFSVLSTFYFSTDLHVLVPLPLRSWEILGAKFGVVLTGQYSINLFILLPLWLRYGLLAGVGLGYVLSAVVVFFALPLLPLAAASLLAVLLMRVVNVSRHKDKLALVGGLLLLVVMVGFQFWLQNSLGSGNPDLVMEQLLSRADGIIKAAGRIFPPSVWAAQAMAYAHTWRGWLNLAYLAAASALALFVLFLLGERVFLQSVLAGMEGTRGSGRARQVRLDERSRSPLATLASLERKLFVRHPGFALNGLVGYVLVPAMALLPLFGQSMQNNPFELLALDRLPSFVVVGGIALYYMFMTGMSMIPATTFSREGKHLWIIRSLPLSIEEIIAAKVLGAQVVNTIGCLLGVVPIAFIMGWAVWEVVLGSVLGILLATALAGFLVLFDLRKPMLDWVNPIKAVKSNLNALVGMFIGMGLAFGLGALIYANVRSESLWLIPAELLGAALVLGLLVGALIRRWAPRLWTRI